MDPFSKPDRDSLSIPTFNARLTPVLGRITPRCEAHIRFLEFGNSLTVPETVVELSQRPKVVVGVSPLGKSRIDGKGKNNDRQYVAASTDVASGRDPAPAPVASSAEEVHLADRHRRDLHRVGKFRNHLHAHFPAR